VELVAANHDGVTIMPVSTLAASPKACNRFLNEMTVNNPHYHLNDFVTSIMFILIFTKILKIIHSTKRFMNG
jgi:hypothetical protein